MAVLSILYTAPLGAWAISLVGKRVLEVAPGGLEASKKAAVESEAELDGGVLV